MSKQFKKIIENHLKELAKKDESVARNLKKENKSIDECLEYIKQQAQKEKDGNCAIIEDCKVFGWAVHYYDEDDITVKGKTNAKVVAPSAPETEEKPKTKKTSKKAKKDNDGFEEFTIDIPLF